MPACVAFSCALLDSEPESPTISIPVFPTGAADVVPLLRLTHFQFSGTTTFFEALAPGLAAPFLQDLEIVITLTMKVYPIYRLVEKW